MQSHDGHSPTEADGVRHTVPLPDLEVAVARAGVVMSRRQLMRHCQAGVFDAKKVPAANNVPAWFVASNSIAKGIADLKALKEYRLRGVPTQSDSDGHSPTMTDSTTTPVMPDGDIDITEHWYVKKLYANIDKLEQRSEHLDAGHARRYEQLEAKYERQIKETQAVMLRANEQLVDANERLIELQKASQVAQSKTLAEYLLRAKEFLVGPTRDASEQGREMREEVAEPSAAAH